MDQQPASDRGRGTAMNPTGRFEPLDIEYEEEHRPRGVPTQYYVDTTKSVLSTNDSPDIGFNVSLNPYRGCEHGCAYCYARPTHEYLGLSCGLDFETKIFVKPDAAKLLREALSKKSWKPQVIAFSGVTDPYQPIEKKLGITRQCLEVLAEFRNPVGIVTKNHLITRDIDILKELAKHRCISASISITTLDSKLAGRMEPRASRPAKRLQAIKELSNAGIPVGVNVAPIVPGLTDHEMADILKSAAEAGARGAGYVLLRLPHGVKDLFPAWLKEHYPYRKERVLNRIREMRNGALYHSEFGERMTGTGTYAEHIAHTFATFKKRYGLERPYQPLSIESFWNGEESQLALFQQ